MTTFLGIYPQNISAETLQSGREVAVISLKPGRQLHKQETLEEREQNYSKVSVRQFINRLLLK